MAKAMRIKMTHKDGTEYYWTVRRFEDVWNCGGNLPRGRYISGWEFEDHEGCVRCFEGNWVNFVPLLRLVADNYGMTTQLS